MTNSKLEPSLSLLVSIGILASLGDQAGLKRVARKKTFQKVPRKKVVETLLEVHLFAGYPATIEAFITLDRHIQVRRTARRMSIAENRGLVRKRGENLCRVVYGDHYNSLIRKMRRLNPDLAEWILEHGYGRVLSRPGLSAIERELIAVGILAALGWERQLRSHARGAANAGASDAEIDSVRSLAARHNADFRRRGRWRK
jgi:alkylhydroperoxidase/carboxymuconolactone decarboxylase family protein YurZ